MSWYTLTYTAERGSRVVLRNLHQSAVDYIRDRQGSLGSTAFWVAPQTRHYSQWEIDALDILLEV